MTVPAHIADILSRLGRIEGKVDAFIKQMRLTTSGPRISRSAPAKWKTASIGTAGQGRS